MPIDPVEYGKLIKAVQELENKVGDMEADIKELLKLANQSRGGFWVGMSIAAALGSTATLLLKLFWR